ncbi:MAG: 6-carboxytetrahydropterin synthase [Azoarcus sp.]|jgi:6-pyruvoyltetrahydropterin/6-carboxytetrahydropterin synthase|nr:6-carboxytetrahydropterin synthase [Azoarcus sp.]
MLITCRLEFDAGHRIPDHASQCRHLHGHRYVLEVSLGGGIIEAPGSAANGMVMDFGEVKRIAREEVIERWDHAFLAWRGDTRVVEFLASLPGHKTVILDAVPTAENLAAEAFRLLDAAYRNNYGDAPRLERVRLYETPNCWAEATR